MLKVVIVYSGGYEVGRLRTAPLVFKNVFYRNTSKSSGAASSGIGTLAQSIKVGSDAMSIGSQLLREGVSAIMHGISQGFIQGISGGNLEQSFLTAAISSIAAGGYGMLGGAARSGVGQALFGTIAGGVTSRLQGGNFWEGAAMGLTVSLLNHVAHKMQENSMLDKAIRKAGFEPEDVARWTNEELTTNMAKIFPELYESANCPSFEIQDVIGGKDNIYGQAQKTITGSQGNYKVVSKGLIYIKKLALNSVRHVASVAGHELNHVADYVSGSYAGWLNKYNNNAHSEVKAYGWELSMGTPEYLFNRQMYNHFLSLTK